MTRSIPSQKLH